MIATESARIVDLQDPTSKMSKSSPPGCLFLLDEDTVTTKKIKSAVTDSEAVVEFDPDRKPGVSNLLSIQQALRGVPAHQVAEEFTGRGYGDLKVATAELVVDALGPIRDATRQYLSDRAELQRTIEDGAAKARQTAATTLARVYQSIGFVSGTSAS